MAPIKEFSHIVSFEPWPADGIVVDVQTTTAEREYLMERFQLIELRSLEARGKIERGGEGVRFYGNIEAEAVQSCVVTLNPVVSVVRTPFERRYRLCNLGEEEPKTEREEPINDEALDIEVLEQREIDVGAVIAEEFYLALDPYPRDICADLVMEERRRQEQEEASEMSANPFAKLRPH